MVSFLLLGLLVFPGCGTWSKLFPNPQQKEAAATAKVVKTQKSIDEATVKLNDKSRAFVFGAVYSNHQETNRTPAIDVSLRFLDLATLTLGNPSVQDAQTIKEIADGLLEKAKIDLEQARADAANARIAAAKSKSEAQAAKNDYNDAQTQLEESKILKEAAEKKLTAFTGDVVKLQADKDSKIKTLEAQNVDLQKINDANAAKASQWDAENGFWASLNPLTDLFKFIKKLSVLTLVGGVLFGLFKILEIFFPELNLLGAFGSVVVKVAKFIVPKAISGAGLVSSSVKTAFNGMVTATEKSLNVIENHDIESDLIANYPPDYKFSHDEVYKLLQDLSDKIQGIVKGNLVSSQADSTLTTLIQNAKIETGIKSGVITKV